MSTFIKSDDSHFFRNVWKEIEVKSKEQQALGYLFLDFQKTGVLIGKIDEKEWKVTDLRHFYESIDEELKDINAKLDKTPHELSQLAELEDMQKAFSKIEKVATELAARSCDIFVRDPDTAVEVNTKTGEMQKKIQETIEKIRKHSTDILYKAAPDVDWFIERSPLSAAVREGKVNLALKLIECGLDVDSVDDWGKTPLMYAVAKKQNSIVELLLTKGADVNKKNKFTSALHIACEKEDLNLVKLLLENKAQIDIENDALETPLFSACSSGNLELVQTLLDKQATVNKKDCEELTPLHVAVFHPKIVEVLIKRGAQVDSESESGFTPLQRAAAHDSLEALQILLAHGADVNKERIDGETALNLAIASGASDALIKTLLDKGAKVKNQPDFWGKFPLHHACERGRPALVEELLKLEAPVDVTDKNGRTPLMYACETGNLEIVQALLSKGADVNKKDKLTALHMAVHHPKIVEVLIKRGAQVDSTSDLGKTPLHHAIIKNKLESVQMLLAHGADVNRQSLDGYTALSLAIKCRSSDILKAILQNKNVKESEFLRFKDGTTPLHELFKQPTWLEPADFAALFSKLSKSCDLTCKDSNGLTPLECLLTSEQPQKAAEVLKAFFPDFGSFLDLIHMKDTESFVLSIEEHLEAIIGHAELTKTLALALLFDEPRLAYAIAANLNSDQFLNMCKELEKAFPKTDVINFLAKTFIIVPSMYAPPLPKDHIKVLAEYLRTKIDVTQKNQKLETPLKQMLRVADYHRESIVKALFSDLGAIQKMSADSIPDLLIYFSKHPEALISDPDNKLDANPLEVAFLFGDIELARKLASKLTKEQFQAFGAKLEIAYPKSNIAEFLFNVEYDVDLSHLSKIMSGKIPPKPPGSKPDDFIKLFDAINFSDPKKPHYVDPGSILGKNKTAKDLRAVIETFVGQVKARRGIQGDHAEGSDARKEFYDTLENGICGIAHFLLSQASSAKNEEQKIRVMKEFITAVAYCGPKIRSTVVRQYNNVVRNYEPTYDNLLYAKETDHRELISDALVPNGPQSVHDYLLVVKQLGKDFGLAASADLGQFDDLYSHAGEGIEPDKIRKSFFELLTPYSIFTNVTNEIAADDEFREQYATWWQAHAPDGWQGDLKEVLDEMKRLREKRAPESEVIAYLASKGYDTDKPEEDMEAVRRQRFVEKEVYEDMAKNRFNPAYIAQSLQRLHVLNPAITFSE